MKKTKAVVLVSKGLSKGPPMALDAAAAAMQSAVELAKQENRRLKGELDRREDAIRDLKWALKEARNPTPVSLRWRCETCSASGVIKLDPDGQSHALKQLLENEHPCNGLEVLINPGDLSTLFVARSPTLTIAELGSGCFVLKHL